jgi:hypothetical protein
MVHDLMHHHKNLPQPNHMTIDQVNRKQYVVNHTTSYRIQFIFIIYLLNTINAIIFDSITIFPIGWVLAGIIALVTQKSTDLFHVYVARLFRRLIYDIDYYNIIYYSRSTATVLISVTGGTLLGWIIINSDAKKYFFL